MSLLLKALKQAERKNKESTQAALETTIELPAQEPAKPIQAAAAAPILPEDSPHSESTSPGRPLPDNRSTDQPSATPENDLNLSLEASEPNTARNAFPDIDTGLVELNTEQNLPEPVQGAQPDAMALQLEVPEPLVQQTPEEFPRHEITARTPAPSQPPALNPTPTEAVPPTQGEVPASVTAPVEIASFMEIKGKGTKKFGSSWHASLLASLIGLVVLSTAALWWFNRGNESSLPPAFSGEFASDSFARMPPSQTAYSENIPTETSVTSLVAGPAFDQAGQSSLGTSGTPTVRTETGELSGNNQVDKDSENIRPSATASRFDPADRSASLAKQAAPQPTLAKPTAPATKAQTTVFTPKQRAPSVVALPPTAIAQPALPPVQFLRAQSRSEKMAELLDNGYLALRQGELGKAESAYRAALDIDRNLVDGWIGLANIAIRQGNRSLAKENYQRALNINPTDSAARSGLVAIDNNNSAVETESKMRVLLDRAQDNTVALLALANSLARQGRWPEAQQVYFQANSAQPNRPDILFNLAVSLERIRQPAAAISYYEKALTLADTPDARFDPIVAQRRISALKDRNQP